MTGASASTRRGRNRASLILILAGAIAAWPGCGGAGSGPPKGPARPPATNATVDASSGETARGRPQDRESVPGPAAGRKPTSPVGPVTTNNYVLKGVVRSVSPETGRVLIHHEAIPGFMGKMTMPFQPADESILGLVRPGDQVEGILHVETQDGAVRDYQLRDLKVTKPAPPRTLSVDAKGKVQVRQQPQPLRVGEDVPDFVMTGQDGRPIKLSDLRGKVVVLTFIYTRCPMPDFCPLMDRKFSDLAQHLGAFPKRAKDIRLLSISFDPENDTPEVLGKHAATRGATPPLWTYAVASHEELARIAPLLGLMFAPDGKEIAHNLCTAIIDPRGKLARLEVGRQANRWDTADFLKTIYGLLPGGAK
jgi:protein SCO1/2